MLYTRRTTPARHRLAARLVALGCFGAYVAGLAPSPYWLDSSEFATAAFTLGVAHPPGHPLEALVGKLFALLPLGPVALRVGLASAALGAFAAALVVLVGAQLARRVSLALGRQPDEGIEAALGAAAGVYFGSSYAAAFQAVRPEVYALNAALLLLATHALLRFDLDGERGFLYTAALALGLALGNHHFLAALYTLVAAVFVLARRPARAFPDGAARPLLIAAGAGVLGLATYAYLPLRALRHPAIDWGVPSTASRFLWTVSARAFQKSLAHGRDFDVAGVAVALVGALGLWMILATFGAYLLARLPSTRRAALLLVGAALLLAAAPAMVGFDPANPDAYGYLEPAVALLAAVGAAAAVLPLGFLPSRARRATAAALVLGALVGAWPGLKESARPRFADTDRLAGAILDEAPPRATLVSSYFQTVFSLWYLRAVEGRRPDIDHLHRHFLSYPGYGEELRGREPALAPLIGARDVVSAALLDRSRRAPVLVEYDLDLDGALVSHLLPAGAIDRLLPVPPDEASRATAEREASARLVELHARLDRSEPQTLRALLWLDFLGATRDCGLGRRDLARAGIDRARALLGPARDPDLEQLARRCGLRSD